MSRDILSDLSRWYAHHCDGEWEHHHDIAIETTDNPGWWVKIDLAGTELEGRAFPAILKWGWMLVVFLFNQAGSAANYRRQSGTVRAMLAVLQKSSTIS
jgi:hypothetical protein